MRKPITTSILAAISLAVLATPAAAETHTARVEYADLDLASPGGTLLLRKRLDSVIASLCGPRANLSGRDYMENRRCYRDLRQQADRQVALLTGRPIYLVVGAARNGRG
jgi:UrcA family protein